MRNAASEYAQERIKSLKTIAQKLFNKYINSSLLEEEEDSMYILNI